jgi:thiosulfate dehydrogenase [quinone] large subunit
MENRTTAPTYLLTILRILVGWHFLYEGITKMVNPSWSAGPFLLESTWWFSGLFKAIATHPASLAVVDFLNVWGLTLIGLGLFIGLFTRLAAWAGALLLLVYYIARPPFIGLMDGMPTDGSYIWVNKNLIEMFLLLRLLS